MYLYPNALRPGPSWKDLKNPKLNLRGVQDDGLVNYLEPIQKNLSNCLTIWSENSGVWKTMRELVQFEGYDDAAVLSDFMRVNKDSPCMDSNQDWLSY